MWADLLFYRRLWRAYRLGRRFYGRYQGLARNISFHLKLKPKLDIYWPTSKVDYPCVIYLHGGLERYATKELFAAVAMKLLPHGVGVIIPDYTLTANYWHMAHEVAAAIAWVLRNVVNYGGNPHRVVVAGHSSGAYLAMLAVLDPQFLPIYGDATQALHKIVAIGGSYDLRAQYQFDQANGRGAQLLQFAGGAGRLTMASPMHFVRHDVPPILLLHGDQDKTVPLAIAQNFNIALQSVGAPSELKVYYGAGHTDLLFAALTQADAPIIGDLVESVYGLPPSDLASWR